MEEFETEHIRVFSMILYDIWISSYSQTQTPKVKNW